MLFLRINRALAYANKADLFYVQLYEIVDVYIRFEKFSNLNLSISELC